MILMKNLNVSKLPTNGAVGVLNISVQDKALITKKEVKKLKSQVSKVSNPIALSHNIGLDDHVVDLNSQAKKEPVNIFPADSALRHTRIPITEEDFI